MSSFLKDGKFKKGTYKLFDDKSGKSISTGYHLEVNGGTIEIEHMDWSKNMQWDDNVSVSLNTNEVIDWMNSNYGAN